MMNIFKVREILSEDDGLGTVEVLLIMVVLIALVGTFKPQINSLGETIFDTISSSAKSV